MKSEIKKGLSLFLAIVIIFSSTVVGLGEVDFSNVFAVKAKAINTMGIYEDNSWTLDDSGTLVIYGTGEIADWEDADSPWHYLTDASYIKSVFISKGITSIGVNNFQYCINLTSITIPDSVTNIERYAFRGCTSLSNVRYGGTREQWSKISIGEGNEALTNAAIDYGDSLVDPDEVLVFQLNDDGESYNIIRCDENACGKLDIPSEYNGKPVTGIGYSAFIRCRGLTSITIPDSVTKIYSEAFFSCAQVVSIAIPENVEYIGSYAFAGCKSLTSIKIPNGVTNIGDSMFYNCSNLEEVIIPDSVTSIGRGAFEQCNSLKSITIPNGVTNIRDSMFYNCLNLEAVIIPDSVTSIGHEAFFHCKKITSVTIPDAVMSIDYNAFDWCESLKSISVGENNTAYTDVDGVLFNKDKTTLIKYPEAKTSLEYIIPDSVTSIGDSAFYSCEELKSVTIPDSVVKIGKNAFTGCPGIETFTIGKGLKTVGDFAFSCSGVKTVNISDLAAWCNIEYEYSGMTAGLAATPFADSECADLYVNGELVTDLVISDGVTEIKPFAFARCNSIKTVTIPDSVKTIGRGAFAYCDNLESVTISDGVTEISPNTFSYCYSLKNIAIPDSVKTVGSRAFYDCISLKSIAIPDSITTIDENAFSGCVGLNYVFYSATESEWQNLRESSGSGNDIFWNALIHYNATDHEYSNLSIKEPTCSLNGQKSYSCFCGDFIEILPALGHNWLDGVCSVCGFSKDDAIESEHPYGNDIDETWSLYKEGANRIAITFSEDTFTEWYCDWIYIYDSDYECVGSYCGDALAGRRIIVNGDTITINLTTDGSASYYGFSVADIEVFYEECTHLETEIRNAYPADCYEGYTGDKYCVECGRLLECGETIPGTGHSMVGDTCENCGASNWSYWIEDDGVIISGYNGNESNLIIPDTFDGYPVTGIGDYAFDYNENIVSVTIPDTVETIGWAAFDGCINLTSVKLPKNLKTLDVFAFQNCKKLTSITLPDGLVEIGACAFWACEEITSIAIPGSVTSMGYNVFSNCKKLTSITIPDSVTGIDSSAFRYSGYYYDDSNWEDGVLYIGNHLLMASRSVPVEGSDVDEYIDIRAEGDYVVKQGTISIADWAFSGSYITSAEIPDSVKKISYGAFSSVEKLRSINVDSKNEFYTSVDGVLFNKDKTTLLTYPASKINKSYIIPNGVTNIAQGAFSSCEKIESVIITNGVISIGSVAFSNCKNIKDVVIPDGVTSIGGSAFNGCTSLESIAIPKSVTEKNNAMFWDCYSLKYVFYSGTEEEWIELGIGYDDDNENINDAIFHFNATDHSCEWEYDYKNKTKTGVCSVCGDEIIKELVTSDVITFTLNSDGKSYTVTGCSKDYNGEIIIPQTYNGLPVTAINTDAFRDCTGITSVVISDGVESIGGSAFRNCTGLTELYIYSDIKSIPGAMCFGCKNLKSVIIPGNVTSVGGYAFGNCSALKCVFYEKNEIAWDKITIGSSNSHLTDASIHFNSTGEHSYTDEWIIDKMPACTDDGSKYRVCTVCNEVEKVAIVATGHIWNGDICSVCGDENIQSPHPYENNMDETWTIYKEGADRIAITFSEDTFTEWDCDWIYIYDSDDEYIGSYTGDELAGRRLVVYGDTVKINLTTDGSVTYYGFSLDEVKVYYEACTHAETEIRNAYSADCYDGYTGDTYCVECGKLLEWGETIPSTGHSFLGNTCENCGSPLWDYWVNDEDEVIIDRYNGNESDVVIPDTLDGYPVTSIGWGCFHVCESLVSVIIPDSVTSIQDSAFFGCENLVSVTIPDSVTSIGIQAFVECTSLTSVTLPDSLTFIGDGAFKDCNSLTDVVIPDGVIEIENSAFYNCDNLKSVTIPDSVTQIGEKAFGYYLDDDSDWDIKIDGFIIYGKEGSAAQAYADENEFSFVTITDEPEKPIQGTENTQIDYENFIIRTSVQNADDIIEILGVSDNATVEATPSYKYDDIELYGTGAKVSVYDGDEFIGEFTLVVDGDTNGDSICDVLDCFDIERSSNGNNALSGAFAMAGDSNGDGTIDTADYQLVVNRASA